MAGFEVMITEVADLPRLVRKALPIFPLVAELARHRMWAKSEEAHAGM
jgi:hypothetical protein